MDISLATGILTVHMGLIYHLINIGKHDNLMYKELETTYHILCQCEGLGRLRLFTPRE